MVGKVIKNASAKGSSMDKMLKGQMLATVLAVYFTDDNQVAYVFASGDVKDLTATPATPNRVYKVVDGYARHGTADASHVCNSAIVMCSAGAVVAGSIDCV